MESSRQRPRCPLVLWASLVLISLALPQAILADDTEEVHTLRYAAEGNLALTARGVGMRFTDTGDISLSVPGSKVEAAYLYWAGFDEEDGGDDTVSLARDGTLVAPAITADPVSGTYGPSFWYDGHYFFVWVADVTEHVLTGDHVYTIADFADWMNRRTGAGLLIVYSDDSLPYGRVEIYDGLDRFYRDWGEGARGETAVNCFIFGPHTAEREADLLLFAGEIVVEDGDPARAERPTALWFLTGTGDEAMPTDMVNAPTDGPMTGILLQGPPDYPLTSADGPQWDTYTATITVPADHTWACFQVESARYEAFDPASGLWMVSAGYGEKIAPPTPSDTPPPVPTAVPTPTATHTPTPTPSPTPSPPPEPTWAPTPTPPLEPTPPLPEVVPEASSLLLLGGAATGLAAYIGFQLRGRRRGP